MESILLSTFANNMAKIPTIMMMMDKFWKTLEKIPGLSFKRECVMPNEFSYYSTKTCAVGTQKNHLNETVLLST